MLFRAFVLIIDKNHILFPSLQRGFLAVTLTCSNRKKRSLSELAFQQHLSLSGPNDGLCCATESRITISDLTSNRKLLFFDPISKFVKLLVNLQSKDNMFHKRKVHLKKNKTKTQVVSLPD